MVATPLPSPVIHVTIQECGMILNKRRFADLKSIWMLMRERIDSVATVPLFDILLHWMLPGEGIEQLK